MEQEIIGSFMGLILGLIIPIGFIIGFILIMRLLGSWMLRINDVIHYQKEIIQELKKLNSKKEY